MAARTISPEQFRDMVDADEPFTVVDTRDEESFESWHIAGAIRYRHTGEEPLEVDRFERETGLGRDDPIVTMCAKGQASDHLADELAEAGYDSVSVVERGMEGWSEVYDGVRVPTAADNIAIVQVQRRAKGCLGYVVGDPTAGVAAAIDPTRHVAEFRDAAEAIGCDLVRVFDTHVHADHVSGGRRLADTVGVPYHLGRDAADRDVGYEFEPVAPNEVVRVGDIDVKALATPGHTSDQVSYLLDGEAAATGDALFTDSVGRTELQFGDRAAAEGAELLYESLHRTLLALPEPVTVLPGHASVTNDGRYRDGTPGTPITATVGSVRTGLPLLQLDRSTFVERLQGSLPDKPPNYERVIAINTGRSTIENEQEATELELGPNRCAME